MLPLSVEPGDYCFIDTETRSSSDIKETGGYPYTNNCRVTIVTYAIGDGEVKEWLLTDWKHGNTLVFRNAPADLRAFHERAQRGEAWYVAWNAAFDRLAMSRGIIGMHVDVKMMIDAMAQAVRSHLPPDLAGASMMSAKTEKRKSGKELIKLFCDEAGEATPQTNPEDWDEFRLYAIDDIHSMRDVFWSTMQLSRREWMEYWANEAINDRGLPIDTAFARKAAELAELNASKANDDVARISGGAIQTVNQTAAMLSWLRERLGGLSETDRIMTREYVEVPTEDGEDVVRAPKFGLDRNIVEELIAYLLRVDEEQGLTDDEAAALDMLEVRLYGASATPKKFIKMLPMLEDDRIKGQYVFNGAAATGRFSSRGLQVHNLTRSTVGDQDAELDAIEMISDGGAEAHDAVLDRFGPVGRTLSRLIRPSICAPNGKTLMWCDWSAIEARITPWVSASEGGERVLDVFRRNDADPSLPDIYKVEAGGILNKPATEVTKHERQGYGKVPVLSLGFGGGNGALFNMARAYGASFTEAEASEIVQKWREKNQWAVKFWHSVWDTAMWCLDNPGQPRQVGRVCYLYDPAYRRGTLICVLPCGRPLFYPSIRWKDVERADKKTGKKETRKQLTYKRGRARATLWYGTLVENIVQGVAGSLLRDALLRLETEAPQLVVGHTHDEVIGMTDVLDAAAGREALERVMLTAPAWAEGLPLAAEASVSDYYTKTID